MGLRDWLLLRGPVSDGSAQTQDDPMVPWFFSVQNCVWEAPFRNKTGVNKFASGKSWETYMQVRKQQLELDMEQHTGSI